MTSLILSPWSPADLPDPLGAELAFATDPNGVSWDITRSMAGGPFDTLRAGMQLKPTIERHDQSELPLSWAPLT
jgi:hypothetical protein